MSKQTQSNQDAQLDEILQDLQNQDEWGEQSTNQASSDNNWSDLAVQLIQLQKKYDELDLTCKRAQSDYFRQKMEFDALVLRREEEKKQEKIDAIIEIARKIIPWLWQLQQSVTALPTSLSDDHRAKAVVMVADKQQKDLEQLGVYIELPTLYTDPDLNKHVPVSTQPIDNTDHSGKITQILSPAYIYKKDEMEKVILPASVVVGA